MRLPIAWLKQFIELSESAEEIARWLTDLGLEVESIEPSPSGPVLEIGLTPNLNRCASVFGVARELAAVTGRPLHLPSPEGLQEVEQETRNAISVRVEQPELCPLYTCRVVRGVRVGPSPDWLVERLRDAGLKSVNNVVDVTQWVLWEWGHPLHVFDLNTLAGKTLVVRLARPEESLVTLDEQERRLGGEMLIVADQERPAAVAGILGGFESGVDGETTDVVIEAAYFAPTSIRRTARRLGVSTEASKRFERGVDPTGALQACDLAAGLIHKVAGGSILRGRLEVHAGPVPVKTLRLRRERTNGLLGTQLSLGEVEELLKRLDFKTRAEGDELQVQVPSYRNDVVEEVDLIEEVARLHGYNHIEPAQPSYRNSGLDADPLWLFERRLRAGLLAEGLQEWITCDLISEQESRDAADAPFDPRGLVQLRNPQSVETAVLRPTLLPGLLRLAALNRAQQWSDLAGFEIGKVHLREETQPKIRPVVGLLLTGNSSPPMWAGPIRSWDFFDLKGVIENLLERLRLHESRWEASDLAPLHPGRQATIWISGRRIGVAGQVAPAVARRWELERRLYYAELDLQQLMELAPAATRMAPLSLYPASERDWTLTLPAKTPAGLVEEALRNLAPPLLEQTQLIGLYQPEGAATKNVTFRLRYRDAHCTLSHEEVERVHTGLVESVSSWLQREGGVS
jgi:phenylalanyl-tRNA synthetase beta chain